MDDIILSKAAEKAEVDGMLDSGMEFLMDIDVDALVDEHQERTIYASIRLEANINRSMESFLSQSNNLPTSTQRQMTPNSSIIIIDDDSNVRLTNSNRE